MCRISRGITTAKAVALSGPGVGGRNNNNFRVGAVLMQSGNVLSAKHNELKPSRFLSSYSAWPYRHAESNCILHYGFDRCQGCDLFVARVLRNDSLALAKPCKACQDVIQFAGIRRVFFSANNDNVGVWHVRQNRWS